MSTEIHTSKYLLSTEDDANKYCYHCGEEPFWGSYLYQDGKKFCCHGCVSVYRLLKDNLLDEYYDIKDGIKLKTLENFDFDNRFQFLKCDDFFNNYLQKKDNYIGRFYVEGVHCHACIWLIEKLANKFRGIQKVDIDLYDSTLKIEALDKNNFYNFAKLLNQFGYRIDPFKSENELHIRLRNQERKQVLRLGVSGFLAMNIMFFGFGIYTGATETYERLFSYLMLALFIPCISYGAFPFYKNAWYALRKLQVSIDIPLSFAILLGSALSIYNTFQGSAVHYFDSLSALIFLMLASRYLLHKINRKAHSLSRELPAWYQQVVTKVDAENEECESLIQVKDLKVDSYYMLRHGETIPVDSKIMENAYINTSFLTGEYLPKKIFSGEIVQSGSVFLGKTGIFKVTKDFNNSYISHVLTNLSTLWRQKCKPLENAEVVATRIVTAAFLVGLAIFSYLSFTGHMEEGLNRLLSILIITCPCAIGIGIPLTYFSILSRLMDRGVIIKDPSVLKSLVTSKNIFFDKTGTLTDGKLKVVDWDGVQNQQVLEAVYNLEVFSSHPVAQTLRAYCLKQSSFLLEKRVDQFKENLGSGVSGRIDDSHWEIRRTDEELVDQKIVVCLYKNKKIISKISLEDEVKFGAKSLIELLRKMNKHLHILTGDNTVNAEKIGHSLGLKKESIFSKLSPFEKKDLIVKCNDSIMIGDGANDLLALGESGIGIVLGKGLDMISDSERSGDIYIPSGEINSLKQVFISASNLDSNLKRNIYFSVTFNIFGIVAASAGLISPLAAAVLMPLSSIFVLWSSTRGKLGEK